MLYCEKEFQTWDYFLNNFQVLLVSGWNLINEKAVIVQKRSILPVIGMSHSFERLWVGKQDRNLVIEEILFSTMIEDDKQRTWIPLTPVQGTILNRIERENCDAKLADIWPIEQVRSVLKGRLRR